MQKKISAAFIVMLFLLGVVSVPVQAHFTLGKYTGTYDYHTQDYDGSDLATAHIPGLTGYVFPGAGPLTSPAPGFIDMSKGAGAAGYPGYQSLYPGGNPKGSPQMWLQADANAYAPFGAILTSTIKAGTAFNKLYLNENPTIWGPNDNEENALAIEKAVEGDLVFGINYTLPVIGGVPTWPNGGAGWQFDRVEIWIPPEFQGIKKENIVVSFTNNWGNIGSISKPDVDADIVPNHFQRIRINTDTALGGYKTASTGLTFGNTIIMGNSTYGDVWAYVRINKVTAPTIAGKYFFKMGMRLRAPTSELPASHYDPVWGPSTTTYSYTSKFVWLGSPANPYDTWRSNGVPNFPVVLVKGEVDPAYVDGTVRYGGYSGASYYGMPIALPGRVRLVGRAIDPFTLATTNRPVEARGYFNQSAIGHFEVEGVAPGIYDIYASCAGYPEKLIQTGVTILKGQSYHVDAYLTPGVVIQGEIFSKCGTGEVNWVTWQHNTSANGDVGYQDMKIEIYKVDSVPEAVTACKVTQDDVENVMCYAETPAVAFSPTIAWYDAIWSGWGRVPVQFQWPGYGSPYNVGADSYGVGPKQEWRVLNTQASFKFQFGDKGLYGTPAMLDGHVPQLNATWVDGLPAGPYEVRAFTYGYVQTKADGVTFEHVAFNVPAVEWPGDIYIPFDLRLSNYVKKTVHFHDIPGTLAEKPVPGKSPEYRTVYLKIEDSTGLTVGWKTEPVLAGDVNQDIFSRGIRAETMAYWGVGGGRNYGIESGTYTVSAYMWGYVEQAFEKVTIGLCGSEIAISDHMYRGVMFNVTFYSKDWEHPTADKEWKYPDEYIYFQIWKGGKQLTGYGYDGKNAQAAGSEYYLPDGSSFTSDGSQQPFVTAGTKVTSVYRVKAGNYVNGVLKRSWADPKSTTFEKSFSSLYYEGQEAYHGITTEQVYYYDADWNVYPEAFESGLYELKGLTYGYVMQYDPLTKAAKPFQVYATKGGVANIPIKLVVGVQIPLIIRFKHERIFEHLRMNSTVRVRVFDDKDALVGEWLTSGSINGTTKVSTSDYSTAKFDATSDSIIKGLPENILPATMPGEIPQLRTILGPGFSFINGAYGESVNYVPRSTMMLNLTICGLPDPYACGSGTNYAYLGFDRVFDVRPWVPGKYGAPGAPYGINGDPWYTGGFYVEVEVVPVGREIDNHDLVYRTLPWNNGGTVQPSSPVAVYDNWYPPVAGLLYGESCTIDPRTGKLYSWSLPQNHIGPYQQRVQITLPGAHLGGESSGILELDHLGLAQGVVYSYTWCDDWRTTSWVSVLFSGAPGALQYYTFDGTYQAYLPAGTWKMDVIPWLAGVKAPGYGSQSFTLAVSEGQTAGYNVYLEETGVPIPEFPTALVVLVSALAAALSILRRRRK